MSPIKSMSAKTNRDGLVSFNKKKRLLELANAFKAKPLTVPYAKHTRRCTKRRADRCVSVKRVYLKKPHDESKVLDLGLRSRSLYVC